MRIDLLFPVLPPVLDGIGDHTARMARAMAGQCNVRVLTTQTDASPIQASPIQNVRVEPCFTTNPLWKTGDFLTAVASDPPDWLIVQFNQFSYGRWGLNPFLPRALRKLRHVAPDTRVAWVAHEDFVPPTSLKFRLMRLWQRRQFIALGRQADRIFFSIDPWVNKYGPWFKDTPVYHLPIGSNMPRVDDDPLVLRRQLRLDNTFVVGFFGTLRARLLGHLKAAVSALQKQADDVVLLYVGPDGHELRHAFPVLQILDAGRLSEENVSRHLAVMDLHLTPFIDGVSTRRGSFMAGLQHGIPTLATRGELTDRVLRRQDGRAFVLAPTTDASAFAQSALNLYARSTYRERIGRNARRLYDEQFAFEVTVPAMLDLLCSPKHAPDEDHSLHAHC